MRWRRGSSFVTKTACTECRKGRAKCDGQKPCARCASKGLICEYEIPVHVRKEDMRHEIKELRRHRQLSEKILEMLGSGDQSSFIISKLQQHEPLEDIVKQLGGCSPAAGSIQSGPSSQARRDSTQTDRTDRIETEDKGKMEDLWHGPDDNGIYSFKHGSRWTEVPLSDTVVEHLLLLYFCWEYPIFSGLSKRHFARDFNAGQGAYCSSLLVNGILAVGCRFSDQVEARMDPEDSDTAGMHCYLEAERLLSLCRGEQSVTVVQGMCLMSSWNASQGHYRKARYYAGQAIRIAVEMGLHQDSDSGDMPDDLREVQYTAFWGAFMLDQAWSLATGCLPHISQDGILIPEPTAFDVDELMEWIPHTGDIAQKLDLRQPSNVHAVYKSLCELSTIIHSALYVTYADTDPVHSRDILDLYTRILGWYSSLPEVLRLGENSTPSVLFVHMYYHFTIILTFYPLMNSHFLDSNISALEVCMDAADAVTTLVRSYENLHGLRRTPCFLPYILFASGIVHLGATKPKINPIDTLIQSAQEVAILQLMSVCHGSSKRACRILLSRALHPSAPGGPREEDSEADEQSPWEPFARTMIWPATDSRRLGSSIEGLAQLRVSNRRPRHLKQLRRNEF